MKTLLMLSTVLLLSAFRQQTSSDMEMILQQCIDLPRLQPYYNIDKFPEERKPLILMKSNVIKGELNLTKFGVPVKILSREEIWQMNTNAYMEFFRLNIIKDTCFVKFQYKIEGIQMELRLEKESGQWVVKKDKII